MKKTKILVLADHPLSPSGVGTQTKYFIETMLQTGRYSFVCLGAAIKHQDYRMMRVDPWQDDWRIFPIDGYGNHETIRSIIQKERPDVLWFMTDPRFFGWLWEIENEIRANLPMIYYHVWDNFPAPSYNGIFYRSTDEVVCISKVTKKIVDEVAPETPTHYIPHAVNHEIFYPYTTPEELERVEAVRQSILNASPKYFNPDKKIFFWNNRNARRKQSGTLVWWFKEFLDKVGHHQACLLMHTDARDPHGQDLPHLIEHLGVGDGQILLSTNKVDPQHLAGMCNAADFTINISDAEGFGLATLESLACGTPIIVNMTGGLQEQVTNGKHWFGWGIKPASKAIIGSLQVPYIYEDRISQTDFERVMKMALKLTPKKYAEMSRRGLKHVNTNYAFSTFQKQWIEVMDGIVERHGSWDTRKLYKRWHLKEVA